MREQLIKDILNNRSVSLEELAEKYGLSYGETFDTLFPNWRDQSIHQTRVEELMLRAGQEVPLRPTVPSEEVRLLRARLILEETKEALAELGYNLDLTPNGKEIDIVKVVKECCDVRVVTTGALSAFGVCDQEPQKIVDQNNLLKFSGDGYLNEYGKWVKPSNHPKCEPEIKEYLCGSLD